MTITETLRDIEINPTDGLVVTLPSEPESVPVVRNLVKKYLGPRAQDEEMMASELATNSATHGTPEGSQQEEQNFTFLVARLRNGESFMLFADNSPELPEQPIRDPLETFSSENGRGIMIVNGLSDRWGATREVPPQILAINSNRKKVVYTLNRKEISPEVMEAAGNARRRAA